MNDQNSSTTKRSHTDDESNNRSISECYDVKDDNEFSVELSSKKMKLEHGVHNVVVVSLGTETTATTLDGLHLPNNKLILEKPIHI